MSGDSIPSGVAVRSLQRATSPDGGRDVLRRARAERNRLYLSENAVSAAARTLLAATGGDGDDEAWAHILNTPKTISALTR